MDDGGKDESRLFLRIGGGLYLMGKRLVFRFWLNMEFALRSRVQQKPVCDSPRGDRIRSGEDDGCILQLKVSL